MGEKWADPVFRFRADGVGAEGVDVIGNGSLAESGGGELERTFEIPRVPTCVECDLIPRGPF